LTDIPVAQLMKDGKLVRGFIAALTDHLAPATVREITNTLRQGVEHIKDDNSLLPIFKWQWDNATLKVPEKGEQSRVAFMAKQVEQIIERAAPGRDSTLCALSAAAPVRFGEVTSLRIWDGKEKIHGPNGLCIGQHSYVSADCRTLHIRKQIQKGKECDTKTPAGVRDIDLCPEIAAVLKDFIGDRKSGYVFETENGTPISLRNFLRDCLGPILYGREARQTYRTVNGKQVKHIFYPAIEGVAPDLKGYRAATHAFRRFVIGYLRNDAGVPRDLTDFWEGHGPKEMGARYTQMATKAEWRRQWAEKAGLGFKLPVAKVTEIKTAGKTAQKGNEAA
jgi:hypothetical protein